MRKAKRDSASLLTSAAPPTDSNASSGRSAAANRGWPRISVMHILYISELLKFLILFFCLRHRLCLVCLSGDMEWSHGDSRNIIYPTSPLDEGNKHIFGGTEVVKVQRLLSALIPSLPVNEGMNSIGDASAVVLQAMHDVGMGKMLWMEWPTTL